MVTDRLGKGIICDGLPTIDAEAMAKWFVRVYYRQHALLRAIVSDRGKQFVGILWARICSLLGITRRLSTAYHPETDGSTERMNQTLETYLRMFVDFAQDDWFNAQPSAVAVAVSRPELDSARGQWPLGVTAGYGKHRVFPVAYPTGNCANRPLRVPYI